MPQGRMSALSAIDYCVESLVRVFEEGTNELQLPIVIGSQPHRLEY